MTCPEWSLTFELRRTAYNNAPWRIQVDAPSIESSGKSWISARLLQSGFHTFSLKTKGRKDTATEHLRRFQLEGQQFLERLVASDEKWAYSFEPEPKRQTSEWHGPPSPKSAKVIRSHAAVKVIHITFLWSLRFVFDFPVPPKSTGNGELYLDVLRNHVIPAIRKKRSDMANREFSYPSSILSWLLNLYCSFFLFPHIKKHLRGKKFHNVEAIKSEYASHLRELARSRLEDRIFGLVHRWESMW